ncbi:MAG: response regulator [Planctomycetota bacterium]
MPVLMLVDDDPVVLNLMTRALRDRGMHLLAFDLPLEALDRAKEPGFHMDVLLTDLAMPKMTGSVLASRLRELHPEMRALFTSGYLDPDVLGSLPPDAQILEKPFSVEQLRSFVDGAIEASDV